MLELPTQWTSAVCPRPEGLEATLAAELERHDAPVVHGVDVTVTREDEDLVVAVTVQRGARSVRRTLPVARCDLVLDAAALVVGLAAIDDDTSSHARPDDPPSPEATSLVPPPPDDDVPPATRPRPPRRIDATRPAPPERFAALPRSLPPAALAIRLDAGARGGFVEPWGASFGVSLGPAWPRFFLDLGFRHDTPTRLRSTQLDGAGVRVSWWLASARVGFVLPLGRRWALPLYVRADAGVVRAKSFGVEGARTVHVPWVAPGLGAGLQWQLRARWALWIAGELSIAATRHDFVVAPRGDAEADAGLTIGATERLGGAIRVGTAFRWP